ncbi:MAG: hypothetical protein ISS71_08380 [Phycisphaerae bacterium]|nr:hypothetical protein [Phycisphaerae bacterium]
MVHIVWLAGAVTAIMGIAILFKPIWMRQSIIFINKGKVAYGIAGSKTVLGIIFLILATQCKISSIIIALGILMTIGPLLFCLLPFTKIQAYMNWWIARPEWMYRLWGVVAMLLGGLIFYAGVPK